jgi:hypothetical protein
VSEVLPEMVPIPLSILIDVAPVTLHESVVVCPKVMVAGDAINDAITGADGGADESTWSR